MNTIAPFNRPFALALCLVVALLGLAPAFVLAQANPTASPQASPVAVGNRCDGLGAYFQALAGLTLDNEGLVIMREASFDALVLSNADAATVVTSIETVLPALEALQPPAPAALYHGAYLEMMAWYRDLAADRDEASHQRLINNDRRLFSLMGRAIQAGQTTCGYAAWTDARDAAFPPEE